MISRACWNPAIRGVSSAATTVTVSFHFFYRFCKFSQSHFLLKPILGVKVHIGIIKFSEEKMEKTE